MSGSPLIILEVLKENELKINNSLVNKINVIFNEKDQKTFNSLKANCNDFENLNTKINVQFYNTDFQILFNKLYSGMLKTSILPRLMFLDQFGVKEITNDIFKKLISLKRSDFVFFISSSFVRRFNELPEFNSYIKINKEDFNESKPFHSHKIVFEYYKSLINTSYVIAPFSIKKGVNIYGLIFGSNHSLGIEKFLKIGWRINPNTGDENYNIDEEKIIEGQFSLFEEDNTIKKLGLLEKILKESILKKNIVSLYKLYLITLDLGCQPKHCNEVLRKLEKEKKIGKVKTLSEKIHKLAPPEDFQIIIEK